MNIEQQKNEVLSYNCTPQSLCFQLGLHLISPAAGETMEPEHHCFGLHLSLLFEGVLGQFGGMKRFYFHTQLEHVLWASMKEGAGWLL